MSINNKKSKKKMTEASASVCLLLAKALPKIVQHTTEAL